MKRFAPLLALPLLALAAPAAAQMKPADPADVIEAIDMCRSITTPAWIYRNRLEDAKWFTAEVRGERRRTRKVRGIYEQQGNRAYVVLTRDELRKKECVVQARLENTGAYVPLLQQVSQSVGMPSGQDGFSYTWNLGEFTMRVEPTGDRDAPSARFAITALPQVGTDDVLAAIDACLVAIGKDGVAQDSMAAAGWTGEETAPARPQDNVPPMIFTHSESSAIVNSGTNRDGKEICQIIGRLADKDTAENLRSALTGKYGTPTASDDNLDWETDGRNLRLITHDREDATGPFTIQIPVTYVGESE